MKTLSPDVYVADSPAAPVGRAEIDFLKGAVASSRRGRARLCAHVGSEDRLHEMFIVAAWDSYVRPAKHLGKTESMHIIEGEADLVFFDAQGEVTGVLSLAAAGADHPFFCRTPENVYHALLIRSDLLVYHECTTGPFRREDTVFPDWAPAEDAAGAADYRKRLAARADTFLGRRG